MQSLVLTGLWVLSAPLFCKEIMAQKKRKRKFYTRQGLIEKYGLTAAIIDQYFPEPVERLNRNHRGGRGRKPVDMWSESAVNKAMKSAPVQRELSKIRRREEKRIRKEEELRNYLLEFDVERYRSMAEEMERHFILHIGPTNSGKTYDAIQALKSADNGLYLGPLRLLALEMYDTLNEAGCPCNLLTGEEFITTEGASHISSTIELCTYDRHFEVAVIDEAQMLSDRNRGDRWLHAIYCVDASEVHICMAPEAEELICNILNGFQAEYEIQRHERLAPLYYLGPFQSIKDTEPGDALIVFSRKAVLAVAAELEQLNIKASVIYGALPPASRREEIRKFTSGETTVVVATDAIGMGVSLPIRRIIFCEVNKFDGFHTRFLHSGEIKQIAGRAGRFGIYNEGYVQSMLESSLIESALAESEDPIRRITLPFPEEALDSDYPLDKLLEGWDRLPEVPGIARADMTESLFLYEKVKKYAAKSQKHLVFRLITCPFDIKDEELVNYWLDCCREILQEDQIAYREVARQYPDGEKPNQDYYVETVYLPEPYSGEDTLETCERRYRELDILHQLLRGIGIEEDRMDEKLELCRKINVFLTENKEQYLRRCRRCGRMLPATYSYGLCEKCFHRQFYA